MRASRFFSLVAAALVPLAASMPAPSPNDLEQHHGVWRSVASLNFAPMNLTNIGMECARDADPDLYDCELRFDWFDPNSVPENEINDCTCITKWQWDGHTETHDKLLNNYANGQYTVCFRDLPMYFEFRIRNLNSTQAIDLEIAHHYKDAQNFSWPWDYPTTFAVPTLHLPVLERSDTRIRLYDAGPMLTDIMGISD